MFIWKLYFKKYKKFNEHTLSYSWSPNATDLYFWYLFVELAVVTPVEPRNFVSVVPAAKKGKLGPIFFFKYLFHVHTIGEKAKNRTKNGQKNLQKRCFSCPFDQLAEFEQILNRSKSV